MHGATLATFGQAALRDKQVHRTYTLLEWMISPQRQEPSLTNEAFNMRALKETLEMNVWRSLQADEAKPLPYPMAPQTRLQKPKTARSKSSNQHNEGHLDSAKAVRLPVFASVDEDKRPASHSDTETRMRKRGGPCITPRPKAPPTHFEMY